MATVFGTHDIRDVQPYMQVADIGQAVAFDYLGSILAVYEEYYGQLRSSLFGRQTTNYSERIEREQTGRMMPADEWSRAPTRKIGGFELISYPIKRWSDATGWTEDFLVYARVEQLLRDQRAQVNRDIRTLTDYALGAFLRKDQYVYPDPRLNVDLTIKPFLNGDAFVPPAWYNVTHTSPHNHYIATAAATAATADYKAMYTHLNHHGFGNNVQLWIATNLEDGIRAMTADFAPVPDPALVYPGGTVGFAGPIVTAAGGNPFVFGNRIGRIHHMDVIVQPFMPDNYAFAWDTNQGPPLLERMEEAEQLRGLRLVSQEQYFPLRRSEYQRRLGFAVANRINGVALHQVTGGVYANPANLEYGP